MSKKNKNLLLIKRLVVWILYLLSGFILAKQYSVDNARLVLKVSVFYLPILFLTIMVDKLA